MIKKVSKFTFAATILIAITNCNGPKTRPPKAPAPSAGAAIEKPNIPERPSIPRGSPVPGKTIEGSNDQNFNKCLPNLKSKSISRQLQFINESVSLLDDDFVVKTNQAINTPNFTQQRFTLTRKIGTKEFSTIRMQSWNKIKKDNPWQVYEAAISSNDSGSISPYSVKLLFTAVDSQGRYDYELQQKFGLSNTCELQLQSTKVTAYDFKGKNKLKVIVKEYYPDTGDKETSREYALADGEFIYVIPPRITKADLKTLTKKNLRIFETIETPLRTLKVSNVKEKVAIKNNFTHKETKGTLIDLSILADNVEAWTTKILDASPIAYQQTLLNHEIIDITQTQWMNIKPNELLKGSHYAEIKIPAGAFEDNSAIKLKLTYEDGLDLKIIEPYWKITSQSENEAFIESLETFENDSVALTANFGEDSKKYLKDTQYIQTSLPKIKKMAKNLKDGFTGTRIEMAEKILKLISSTLVYDTEMVKNNIIRPLKTKEILNKKNGVCQHYANLFTALARAVGIPTRIISGYLLEENKAGPHAWVEIETKPGVWRPIEPQNEDLEFKLKKYFPVSVSASLDDPQNSELFNKETLMFTNAIILEYED
jgi:hypothetical protein